MSWITLNNKKKYSLYFLLLYFISNMVVAQALQNELKNHAAPYLRMHGSDPVYWQKWDQKVIASARKQHKLILISSGYYACHWCHVMQRESYKNKAVAEFINQHFIAVKIDRELYPALDSQLIDFVSKTRGHAGWPLNVFVTDTGFPLVGFTYLPRQQFLTAMQRIEKQWQANKDNLRQLAQKAHAKTVTEKIIPLTAKNRAQLITRFKQQALLSFDHFYGGFGETNKFPMSPQLLALLYIQKHYPNASLENILKVTLDNMAKLALRDHLQGGFFRYTTDISWRTPHYEKMLYDNALLIDVYLTASELFNNEHYKAIAFETLDFLIANFKTQAGAFISSFSAVDENNKEGGYYFWNAQQLSEALPKAEADKMITFWGLTKNNTQILPVVFNNLNVSKKHKLGIKKQLIQFRKQRIIPADDKALAAWNGLLLKSLAKAVQFRAGEKYRATGEKLHTYLTQVLWQNEQLFRAYKNKQFYGNASLEDYAYVAMGLQSWKNKQNLTKLQRQMIVKAWQKFYNSGWHLGNVNLLTAAPAKKVLADGALPSPSAVLIRVSRKMADWDKQKLNDSMILTEKVFNNPFWYASHMVMLLENSQK